MKFEAKGGPLPLRVALLGVMNSGAASSSMPTRGSAERLFQTLVGGERGRALRAQLRNTHPRRSAEEVEDAVQTACQRFVESAIEISNPAEVYAWLRTTADRILNREDVLRGRELVVDPIEGGLDRAPSVEPGPADQILADEDTDEMATLVREVAESLSERRRNVLALYLAGHNRPEIGERLRLSDRTVKRELLEAMDEARSALARRTGGGCESGEPLVLKFVYGLASSAEVDQARAHLDRCHRCSGFHEQLLEWRAKAAEMLPAPAVAEAASPGLLERVANKTADGATTIKQQILGVGAQAKQQAAATYYRAVDPTPLAGVRPTAVAAVVASCITIGGGAAAYCANQGVNPIGAATGLIAGSEEDEAEPQPSYQPAEPQQPELSTPTYEPAESSPPAEQSEPETTTSESSTPPAEKSEPEPESTSSEPEPQPEGEFEPIEEPAPEPAPEAAAPTEASPEPTESAKPAPVQSSSGAGEFEP